MVRGIDNSDEAPLHAVIFTRACYIRTFVSTVNKVCRQHQDEFSNALPIYKHILQIMTKLIFS